MSVEVRRGTVRFLTRESGTEHPALVLVRLPLRPRERRLRADGLPRRPPAPTGRRLPGPSPPRPGDRHLGAVRGARARRRPRPPGRRRARARCRCSRRARASCTPRWRTSSSGPTRFVQVWLTPDATGPEPAYATAAVALPEGELVPGRLGSPSGRAPVRIGTASATFYVARLARRRHRDPARRLRSSTSSWPPARWRGRAWPSRCRPVTRSGSPTGPGSSVTAASPTELLVWSFRN